MGECGSAAPGQPYKETVEIIGHAEPEHCALVLEIICKNALTPTPEYSTADVHSNENKRDKPNMLAADAHSLFTERPGRHPQRHMLSGSRDAGCCGCGE